MGIEEDMQYAHSIDDPDKYQEYIRACIDVHCPNGTYLERCAIINQYLGYNSNKTTSYQEHTRAIEACLLCYQESMEHLHAVEIAVADMRKGTRKKIKKRRISDSLKEQIQKDKKERETYWKNHAWITINQMVKNLDVLEMQLQRTDALFSDLATEGYVQLQKIMQNTQQSKKVKKYNIVYALEKSWLQLREKLQDVIQTKNALMPMVEGEIQNMRNALQNAINMKNAGHAHA